MGKKKKKKTQPKSESSDKEAESAILLRLARFEKAEGNQNFRQSQFSEAIEHYAKAIDLLFRKDVQSTLLVSLYTNRAISYLYLQNYTKAIEDCQLALELDPNYLKAYICHAFGHFYLQNYEKTFEDLEAVSRLQPTNYALQQDLKKAKEALAQHKKAEGLIKSKKIREVEWMGDFGLLSIDDDDKPQIVAPTVQTPTQTNPVNSSPKNTNNYEPEKHTNDSNKNLLETLNNSSIDKDSVPLLVPIGEILSLEYHNSPMYLDSPISEEEHAAAKEKELGNKAYMECNFEKALVHYSRAIKLNWREPVFLSNRALVYLKLNRFQEAISDCTASIDRKPSIKAFARRAAAWAQLCEYFLAAEDYKHALRFEPKNPDCLKELEKCLVHLEIDYKHKLELDPNNDKLKKSLHNVREDLKRIAQKIDAATMPGPSTLVSNTQHGARPNETLKQTK